MYKAPCKRRYKMTFEELREKEPETYKELWNIYKRATNLELEDCTWMRRPIWEMYDIFYTRSFNKDRPVCRDLKKIFDNMNFRKKGGKMTKYCIEVFSKGNGNEIVKIKYVKQSFKSYELCAELSDALTFTKKESADWLMFELRQIFDEDENSETKYVFHIREIEEEK